MKVTWATDYFVPCGNQYGFSVHNRRSREALGAHVEYAQDAPIALHVGCAWSFRPIARKRNVLYWAWDSPEIPETEREQLAGADAVIVSSSYMIDAVKAALPEMPVYLCHEGVDAERFSYKARRKPIPPRPFRFLWIGAPNDRKGYKLVIGAWRAFARSGKVELYMKTTATGRHQRRGNVVFDSRDLPLAELVGLYHSAHCFVFPTMGEGFGLTCAEAMATGLPVLYTPWSAMTDLLHDSCGYPLRFQVERFKCSSAVGVREVEDGPELPFAVASVDDLARQMLHVFKHYGRALAKGNAAARRIRERFTWTRTGLRLAEIVGRLHEKWELSRELVSA